MNDGAILRVNDLSFAYPGGPPVLDHVSFAVEPGESIALVGPNGAGKTTLFLSLAGVVRVPPGHIRVAGLDPGDPVQRRQLPSRVGIIFQNSDDQLFSSTIADDVAFGPLNLGLPPEEVKQRVRDALQRVGLAGFEERVPYHLSGGEKRRAAIAGVLAMRPEVLLLDEPSMFLDARGRRELIGWLSDYPQSKIIATHDLDLVLETCRRVVVLDRGSVRADGPVAEVLANAPLMDAHGLEVPYRLRG
jgi:cobalt/nickel transport system ATP-binding protein